MTTPALATDRPAIRFRGTTYPVLLPTVLLVGAGVLAVPGYAPYQVGPSVLTELPLALLLLVVAVSAAAAVVTRGHLTLALVLSSTGFLLAVIYALDTGVRGGPEPEQITRENFGLEIPEA